MFQPIHVVGKLNKKKCVFNCMLLIVKFLVKKSATNFEVFLYLLHELVKSDIYDGDLNADLHSAVQTLDLLTQAVDLVGGGLGLLVP